MFLKPQTPKTYMYTQKLNSNSPSMQSYGPISGLSPLVAILSPLAATDQCSVMFSGSCVRLAAHPEILTKIRILLHGIFEFFSETLPKN